MNLGPSPGKRGEIIGRVSALVADSGCVKAAGDSRA